MSPAKIQLAYGENRDNDPAFLIHGETDDPLAMRFFDIVSGNPSYISMADGHTTLNILCLLAKAFEQSYSEMPYIAIVGKHGNPCGAAFDWDLPDYALVKALIGNPVAAMGGELITNFPIDDQLGYQAFSAEGYNTGREKWGLDILLAPEFSSGAIELLGKRDKRRLLANPALLNPTMPTYHEVVQILRGGDQLVQQAPNFVLTPDSIVSWTGGKALPKVQFENLLLAWAITWRASSNTVALTKDNMLIGLGCGQQDRIECARLCIDRAIRAGHNTEGSVFASDAFFPFAKGRVPVSSDFCEIKDYMDVCQLIGGEPRNDLKQLDELKRMIMLVDKREAAELLIDAGCVGGVVPGDGVKLEEVRALFNEANLSVAFLAPEHRGFSKH